MDQAAEVIIKLSALEIQQALAIELDSDSSQALQFLKKKIVDKYFQTPCKAYPGSVNGVPS